MRTFVYAALLAALPTTAKATILATGTNTLNGTTVAAEPNLAGTVVQDVLKAFTFTTTNGTYTGNVQNRVVLAVDNTYDFYWRIRDVAFTPVGRGTPTDLYAFRIGNFGSTVVGLNANYSTDGIGTVGPDQAFVFPAPEQNFVNFNFSNLLTPGQSSRFFFLDTNATSYSLNAQYDFSNVGSTQISGLYSTFGPGGVPEPSAWALLIAGFAAVGGTLRRRARTPAHA